MQIEVKQGRVELAEDEALLLASFEGVNRFVGAFKTIDRTLSGGLSHLFEAGDFTGKAGQTAVLYPGEKLRFGKVILVGLGRRDQITVEGVREGMVIADTAYFYEDSANVELRQLSLTVYTEEGQERALVTAERGWLNLDTNEMTARGNAVLTVRVDNRIIESAELHYDPNADRIWSDSTTVQRLDGTVSEGSSFESNLDFTNVLIRNMRTRGGAVRY